MTKKDACAIYRLIGEPNEGTEILILNDRRRHELTFNPIRLFPRIEFLLIILFVSAASMDGILFFEQTKITSKDRIVMVRNGKKPTPEAKAELVLKEEFTIGAEAGSQKVILEDPTYIAVGDDGLIYVVDRKAVQVKVFNPNGKFRNSIGKRGQGPGEVGGIRDISFTPAGEILINDTRTKRIHYFTSGGKFLRAVVAPSTIGFEGVSQDQRGRIFAVQTAIVRDSATSEIVEFTAEMKKVRTIFSTQIAKYPDFNPVGPQIRFIMTADGGLIWGVTTQYEINILDADGQAVRKILKDYDPLPVTKKYRDKLMKENAFDPSYIKFSDHFPAILDFREDDDGRLYVRLYETTPDESGYIYDVFDREGRYIARTVIEGTSTPAFHEGRIYTIELGPEGTPFVRIYSALWKKAVS